LIDASTAKGDRTLRSARSDIARRQPHSSCRPSASLRADIRGPSRARSCSAADGSRRPQQTARRDLAFRDCACAPLHRLEQRLRMRSGQHASDRGAFAMHSMHAAARSIDRAVKFAAVDESRVVAIVSLKGENSPTIARMNLQQAQLALHAKSIQYHGIDSMYKTSRRPLRAHAAREIQPSL